MPEIILVIILFFSLFFSLKAHINYMEQEAQKWKNENKFQSFKELLTFDWPKPNVLPELIGDGVLEKLFTPNPVEEAPSIPWPKGELVLCPKEFVWPKAEPVCPIEGVEVWNNGDDWVLLGNAGFVVWDGPELKRDGEPKIDGDELTPNVDVVDNEVDPKRLVEVDALKGEELKVEAAELAKVKPPRPGLFGANRLEDIEEEKGLAADWPNVGEGDELKPIPPAGWPAGSGPPEISNYNVMF